MACDEIVQMRKQVCNSLQGAVNTWQYNLQAQWGDPRVYEAEQEERHRQDARLAHDLSRRNSDLLGEAYRTRAQRQSRDHYTRIEELRRRGYRTASTPPESVAEPPKRSRKRSPAAPPADADPPMPVLAAS